MTYHIQLLSSEKENIHAIIMQHYLAFDWPSTKMTQVAPTTPSITEKNTSFSS